MKYVRACPKCGSPDVHRAAGYIDVITGMTEFVCNKCGYQASLFPEVAISKLKTFKKVARAVPKAPRTQKSFAISPGTVVSFLIAVALVYFLDIWGLALVVAMAVTYYVWRKNRTRR